MVQIYDVYEPRHGGRPPQLLVPQHSLHANLSICLYIYNHIFIYNIVIFYICYYITRVYTLNRLAKKVFKFKVNRI